MNAAWGGISKANEITMCLSTGHKMVKNILARKAFTVSMADTAHVTECDCVDVESANDVLDKLARAGFHTTKSEFVDALLIDELAMAFDCRLISYNPDSCRLVGENVNVSIDEIVLISDDKVDVANYGPWKCYLLRSVSIFNGFTAPGYENPRAIKFCYLEAVFQNWGCRTQKVQCYIS